MMSAAEGGQSAAPPSKQRSEQGPRGRPTLPLIGLRPDIGSVDCAQVRRGAEREVIVTAASTLQLVDRLAAGTL
jgi:hypothetical protein